jgi:hypothetical protein
MRYDLLRLTKVGPGRRAVPPRQLGLADVGRRWKNVAKIGGGSEAKRSVAKLSEVDRSASKVSPRYRP